MSRWLRIAVASALGIGGLSAPLVATAATSSTSAVASSVPGSHPAWAIPGRSMPSASVPATPVAVRVYLAGRDPAGLASLAAAVSTPGDRQYGQYLTPAQLRSRFGPTMEQVDAVRSWLTGSGMTVTGVHDGVASYLTATGSPGQTARAFHVSFGMFHGPDGKLDRAPEQAASAPGALASAILAVTGLDSAGHGARPSDSLPPPGPNRWTAPPCADYYGQLTATELPPAYGSPQPWSVCGYTPRQVRSAYGVQASGMTGRRQVVAIVGAYASPTMPADASQYAIATGDKPLRKKQYQQFLASSFTMTAASQCDAPVWYREQSTDIEAVHGQAPDAVIRYVGAASCDDADLSDALASVVDHRLASIVSNSWDDTEDGAGSFVPVYDQILRAGTAEGIGFFFAAGDSGYEAPAEDSGSDRIQVDYPASDPWVTSVGGTSLAVGQHDRYMFETSWGTLVDPLAKSGTAWLIPPPGLYPFTFGGATGGGTSTLFQEPFFQRGVVPAQLSTRLPDGTVSPSPMREVPDVAALADPGTGFLIGQTTLQPDGTSFAFALSRAGGTSVACPTFAGIEADAQQAAGHILGFADPAIYLRNGTSAFHDVTDQPIAGVPQLAVVQSNYANPATKALPVTTLLRTLGIDGQGAAALIATAGYDDTTGVGSPARYVESFLPFARSRTLPDVR